MTQPLIVDLFGVGSSYDSAAKKLNIPITALPILTTTNPTALEIYAAIVDTAYKWLSTNTDTSVMASCDTNAQAPITRNGSPRTQFQYSVRFFGPYNSPVFDPNSI